MRRSAQAMNERSGLNRADQAGNIRPQKVSANIAVRALRFD
jgi:hypothetical protein